MYLKHFFGIIRQACGSNQNPDPQQFIQVYRLLSCYSLIKPPRGSNVSGGEILKSLIDLKINNEEDINRKAILEIKLDHLLDCGDFELLSDHLYSQNKYKLSIDSSALTYFVGYIARNAKKHSIAKSCLACFETLVSNNNTNCSENENIIHLRSKGHLLVPNDSLIQLIYNLETAIVDVLSNEKLNKNVLDIGS